MLKRKTGIVLLTLLFVTGLAGTLSDNTITKEDRKAALSIMKDTYKEALTATSGLSETQLNFRISDERRSIKECFFQIVATEKSLWNLFEKAMTGPSNPEKKAEIKITDEQVINMLLESTQTTELLQPKHTGFTNLADALVDFKANRDAHIKYMKNTTEDLRNHVVHLPFGWIDCYQLYLFIAGHTNQFTQLMNETRFNMGLPPN